MGKTMDKGRWNNQGFQEAFLTANCETANENTTTHCRSLLFDNGVCILRPYHTKELLCPSGYLNSSQTKRLV
jgi:hypothetical protein